MSTKITGAASNTASKPVINTTTATNAATNPALIAPTDASQIA